MFLTNDTNTLVKASEVSASRVKWAAIKGPTRAVEKLQRVYNNDVTRLNDVVRQTIVFASLDDLCTCLKIISADSGSRNLRMKNTCRTLGSTYLGSYGLKPIWAYHP